jgi:hypothetical protein
MGPAVNPIQDLYSKRVNRAPHRDSRMDEIDPDILKQMPLEIQREYAQASSSRNTGTPLAYPSRNTPDIYEIEGESLGSQVDMSVFKDLPADIQQEIRQQQAQRSAALSSPPFISASQLNSKSLLDKTVLEELPEKLQREVRAIIRLNRINKHPLGLGPWSKK